MRLIDADALIMALRLEYPMIPMFKENQEEWGIKTEGYRKAEEVIRNAPTIEPKRGEWICHKGKWIDFDYYPTEYECSQCHHYVDVASDKNFCPNCGCAMTKE